MVLKQFLTWVLLIGVCAAEKLPSDIPLCKAGDVKCISRVSTDLIRTYYRLGRPDMGIPPIDPFRIDVLVLQRQGEGPLDFSWILRDLDVRGLSKIDITNMVGFERDPAKSKFELIAKIPKLSIKGKYNASGRVLILPIEGDGDFEMISTDVHFEAKFKPHIRTKKGQKYLSINRLKIILLPNKVSIKLTNLFNGNKILGDNFNLFLNENWRDVWEEYSPTIYEALVDVIKKLSQGVFDRYSYDDIFLPD